MNTELSASDIVPEDYQMRLMMWRDEFTRGYFEIGDIANEIIIVNIQRGMTIDQKVIFSAVGRFCGKSGRTIRNYAEVASFFPVDVREEYEVLPFAHFRFAKTMGLRYLEVLNMSLENPSISVDALENIFVYHPLAFEGNVVDTNPITWAPPLVNNLPTPAVVSCQPKMSEIYALANLISQSERLLAWDIKKDVRAELLSSLQGLKNVLASLSVGGEMFPSVALEHSETLVSLQK